MAKKNTTPTKAKGKERGKFLTIMLVLGVLGLFSSFAHESPDSAKNMFVMVPAWYTDFVVITTIVTAVAYYGIYEWKKWGVYVLFAEYIVALLIEFTVFQLVTTQYFFAGTAYIAELIPAGLWIWAIARKWQYFV